MRLKGENIMSEYMYTIAELTAKESKFDELKSILTDLATDTRKEAGAIEYFFILDKEKANTILSYEKWRTVDDESAHWETPHLNSAIEKLTNVLERNPVIHKGHQII